MNRSLRNGTVCLASAALLAVSGCFSVTAQAPYGRNIRVLSSETPVEVRQSFQKWYILFGIIPITPADEPERIIDEERLVEARVVIEDTLADVIAGAAITFLTIGVISPTTVTVEGNRAPPGAVAGS